LDGFRFEKRRSDWLLGRWTAKNLLFLAVPDLAFGGFQSIRVENEPSGKPFFVGPNGQRLDGCLSISHRESKSFCAFSTRPGAQLGADLEKIEPRDPIFIEDYLGVNERSLALACEGPERDFIVTLAWSVKEAVFKALGTGLRIDTRKVDISGGLKELSFGKNQPPAWRKLKITCAELHVGAQVFWRQNRDFILNLVVLGDDHPVLHDV
jgi:4'-phosphopantetheinyl transferase